MGVIVRGSKSAQNHGFHFLTRSGGKAEDEMCHNRTQTLSWVEILQNDTSSLGTALVTRSVRPPEYALNVSKYSKGTALSPRAPFMDVCGVRIVENEQTLMYFLTVVIYGKM